MTTYKSIKYNISGADLTGLTAGQIPNLDTAKITTGTFTDARISEASVTQHVTATDLSGVNADITALALREATNEASVAFNLPNQFIETFTDDTNLGTQTDGDRTSGHWGTVGTATSVTDTTLSGNAARSSAEAKFGTYSAIFDGSGDYVTTGELDSIPNVITTGDWTIDYWFMEKGNHLSDRHFSIGDTANGTAPVIACSYTTGGTSFNFYHYGDSSQTDTTVTGYPTANTTTWHHHAIQRDSATGKIYVWIDGTYLSSFDHDTSLMPSTTSLKFGVRHYSSEYFDGHLDEWRLSNIKRYTNTVAFTPATSAYTADANTTLLFHFEDTSLEDESVLNVNATGTLIQSANTVASAKTKVGGTMLYKDAYGTATLGTDLKIYFSCNNGGAWTEAASYNAITPVYSTGIKQVRLGETTCTSGTGVIYKAVWANQASGSKETQLHGIGINY